MKTTGARVYRLLLPICSHRSRRGSNRSLALRRVFRSPPNPRCGLQGSQGNYRSKFMKKLTFYHELENAQVIPLVVISLAVLIMMVALLLDGGALMLNRRTAQNAADAGALAGARELCMGNGEEAAKAVAINYAVTENGATSATADVSYDEVDRGEVIVNVVWEQESFFARVFNQDTLTSGASAAAGCFTKGGRFILPVAWSCRPPGDESDSRDCNWLALDWEDTIKPVREDYCTDP